MIEVGEEARGGNEERVIAMEEIIVLDEGTRGASELMVIKSAPNI